MLQSESYALLRSSLTQPRDGWLGIRPTFELMRGGHVAAARVHDKVLLPGPNLERVPAWNQTRLERNQVLVAQLAEEIVDGCIRVLRHAADAHVAARPPGDILERSNI